MSIWVLLIYDLLFWSLNKLSWQTFQSGRFGKINKRVTFPATLDLSPYMSEPGDGTDIYSLYGVVVHVDMLNASYFGHYICYTKDFHGNWYRIDDCKVSPIPLMSFICIIYPRNSMAYLFCYFHRLCLLIWKRCFLRGHICFYIAGAYLLS